MPGEECFPREFSGKLALVTGASRGIGWSIARKLSERGADLILTGRNHASLENARSALAEISSPSRVEAIAVDLATQEGVSTLLSAFPRVDLLVNNLGVYDTVNFLEASDEYWRNIIDVNVMAGVRITRHYLRLMLKEGLWGRIIFISSDAAMRVQPDMIPYGFTKLGVHAIARGLSELTRGTEITVNTVAPGPTLVEAQVTRLEAMARVHGGDIETAMRQRLHERRPTSLLERYNSPEEVAEAVCFVCSDRARGINGTVLRVDGGIVNNPF